MDMWTTNTSFFVNGNLSNLSSHNQLCTGFYSPVMAVFDILMIVLNLPTTLYVIVELLRQCKPSSNPGNSSSHSLSEVFFLHLCCVRFFYFTGILLGMVRNLGGVSGIRQEYLAALQGSSRIGCALFFAAMSMDLYTAVVHPITYVGLKISTKQKMAHTCCTLIWVYFITLGIVTVIFDISMYHPLPMTSFFIPVLISAFSFILVLTALRSDRPGENSQSSKPDQTKQRAVRFMLNSMVILTFYCLPYSCLLIYTAVKKIEWESLPCHVLPLLLVMQTVELVASLVFLYFTERLKVLATHWLTVFWNWMVNLVR